MKRVKLLMTPGPTMLPAPVLESMGQQIIHHRTNEFKEIFTSVNNKIKKVFKTENPVITLVSSGTGAMESTVANCFSQGDKVVVISIGVFGDRFKKITTRYGLDVDPIDVEWGNAVDPSLLQKKFDEDKDHKIKGVFITQNETSTGVTNDIKAVAEIVRKTDAILIVDAVSSLGAIDLRTDEWGVDVVVTGSQKALMLPPGLAFVSLSKKALKYVENSKFPKFYFDYQAYLNKLENNDTPYTPAITLITALNKSLEMILDEGLDKIYAKNHNLAVAARAGAKALGFEFFADQEHASDLITSVKAPEGIDIEKVRKIMNEKYDIMVTGGQQHLKGKIMRIGHMGYVDGFDLIKTFVALEFALKECGYKFTLGAGVQAVEQELLRGENI